MLLSHPCTAFPSDVFIPGFSTYTSLFPAHYTRPATLIILDFIIPEISGVTYLLIMELHTIHISPLLRQNILLGTLFIHPLKQNGNHLL